MGISNRRLRIDLASIKKALEVGEVDGILWIENEKQVVDGLTISEVQVMKSVGRKENEKKLK